MDSASVSLAEAAQALQGQDGFVRAYLEQTDPGWRLRYVDVVAGDQPPAWQPALWAYDRHLFVAEKTPGDVLAAALTTESSELTLGGQAVAVAALEPQTLRERHPSRARLDTTTVLPWPVLEYRITAMATTPPQVSLGAGAGMMIGEDCPSFPSFWAAFDAFFRPGDPSAGSRNHPMPTDVGRLWVVQPQAWLQQVIVTATHVDVQLGGDRADGVRVELTGTGLYSHDQAGPEGRVQLALPDGLPADAWLYVTRGRQWLDYRRLGVVASGQEDLAHAGVQVETPEDPEAEISAFLTVGEGPFLEYKRQLPDSSFESKRKVLKTVAAFANGAGGTIVFGVDPDELTVAGISGDPKAARDRLGQLIRGNVVPPSPNYQIRCVTTQHKLLLLLEVQPSPEGPYGLRFQDRPVEFFVRRGSSTYAATQQEVRALAARDLQIGGTHFSWLG